MRPVLKWSALGCGCLSTVLLVLFAVVVAIEMQSDGGVSRRLNPAGAAPKPVASTVVSAPQPTATQVQSPAAGPTALPKPGQEVILTTPAGFRLAVTANAVLDPSPSANQFNKPQGRWVVVDWTVRNDGQADQQVNASWLKLITESGYVVGTGNHAGHREPGFESGVLGPGQIRRGFLAYDTPAEQRVKSAIFQSPGNRQFVIAELAR